VPEKVENETFEALYSSPNRNSDLSPSVLRNWMVTWPWNEPRSSQFSSHENKREWTSVDVCRHCNSSVQQIWTLMDVPGRSGNTLKVLGSRPGRPT